MAERICKGIFIPIEIWTDKNLTWNEKILFLEIDSFTSKDKDCFFSNEYIAELLQVTGTTANKVLSSLIKKGYVVKVGFDGRRRFIKTTYSFSKYQETRQGCPDEQGRLDFESNIPNTSNNTSYKEEDKSSKKEEDDEFIEEIYKMYPSRCPKRNTSTGKSKKDKDRIRKLMKQYSKEDIRRVVTYEVVTKKNISYMSNFSTFLNNFPDPSCIGNDTADIPTPEVKVKDGAKNAKGEVWSEQLQKWLK